MLTIRVHPDYGHPSSIWPSEELIIVLSEQPYILPTQIGIDGALGEEVLAWTESFQLFFVEESDDFNLRPRWLPGINPFDWYDEGYRIISKLRAQFPRVQVKPEFAQYVFSVNERRENMGLLPISLPNDPKTGHISISDVLNRKGPELA